MHEDPQKRRRVPYTKDAPKKKIRIENNSEESAENEEENKPKTLCQNCCNGVAVKVRYKELPYTLSEMRLVPRTNEYLSRLAQELVEWSFTEDAWKVNQFFLDRFLSRRVWEKWALQCEDLQHAMDIAKENIGNRREKRALIGEFNASIVMTTMPLHCPEYRKWRESLRPKEVQQKSDIRVFLEPYGSRTEPLEVKHIPDIEEIEQSVENQAKGSDDE